MTDSGIFDKKILNSETHAKAKHVDEVWLETIKKLSYEVQANCHQRNENITHQQLPVSNIQKFNQGGLSFYLIYVRYSL